MKNQILLKVIILSFFLVSCVIIFSSSNVQNPKSSAIILKEDINADSLIHVFTGSAFIKIDQNENLIFNAGQNINFSANQDISINSKIIEIKTDNEQEFSGTSIIDSNSPAITVQADGILDIDSPLIKIN